MNKKNAFFLLFLLFKTSVLLSQTTVNISFQPIISNKPIKNDSIYYFKNEKRDSIQFENIKFYITNIRFFYKNKPIFIEKNSAHLIDNGEDISKKIAIKTPEKLKFDALQFDLGVDSLTNVSGAMSGALDPTTGMYWAWQSGYINTKIEGKTNICPTRKHEFEFHLGGYLGSNYALQTVILPIINTNTVHIYLDMATFIQQINWEKINQIMSPSQEAVQLSKQLATCFGVLH